ncbi:MAG: hypothetical protein IPJ30_00020 [Acidobacteria bacterium]|nr:hypothetical protein [Acidobacteriota bacterium]
MGFGIWDSECSDNPKSQIQNPKSTSVQRLEAFRSFAFELFAMFRVRDPDQFLRALAHRFPYK